MAEAEPEPVPLRYPASLWKLELQRHELKQVIETKVKAIGQGMNQELSWLDNSLEIVIKNLGRRTNLTNPDKSDARCKEANESFQLAGASPDQVSSPSSVRQQNPNFVGEAGKSWHSAQDVLFHLLQADGKLEEGLSWNGGSLSRGNNTFSAEELCNTLDEATLQYLKETKPEESMTTGPIRLGELQKILDTCKEILAHRIFGGGAIEDDILTSNGYKKWKKHVNMIASFAALMTSLTRLLSS